MDVTKEKLRKWKRRKAEEEEKLLQQVLAAPEPCDLLLYEVIGITTKDTEKGFHIYM